MHPVSSFQNKKPTAVARSAVSLLCAIDMAYQCSAATCHGSGAQKVNESSFFGLGLDPGARFLFSLPEERLPAGSADQPALFGTHDVGEGWDPTNSAFPIDIQGYTYIMYILTYTHSPEIIMEVVNPLLVKDVLFFQESCHPHNHDWFAVV